MMSNAFLNWISGWKLVIILCKIQYDGCELLLMLSHTQFQSYTDNATAWQHVKCKLYFLDNKMKMFTAEIF